MKGLCIALLLSTSLSSYADDGEDDWQEQSEIIIPSPESLSFVKWPKKNLRICGHDLQVPFFAYFACKGAIMALPVSCTIGATTSAGTACALDISLASASCALSIYHLKRIAEDCIKGK
jgi:hypothetical protein